MPTGKQCMLHLRDQLTSAGDSWHRNVWKVIFWSTNFNTPCMNEHFLYASVTTEITDTPIIVAAALLTASSKVILGISVIRISNLSSSARFMFCYIRCVYSHTLCVCVWFFKKFDVILNCRCWVLFALFHNYYFCCHSKESNHSESASSPPKVKGN